MTTDKFASRHNGPRKNEIKEMLAKIGVASVDELINQTVPANIRLKQPLRVAPAMSEFQYTKHLKALGKKNKVFRSYIGLGYYNNILPAVIQRIAFRKSRLVHSLHALPSRDSSRTFGSHLKFSNNGNGSYRYANCKCILIG